MRLLPRPGEAQGNVDVPVHQAEVGRIGDQMHPQTRMPAQETRKRRHQDAIDDQRHRGDPDGAGRLPIGSGDAVAGHLDLPLDPFRVIDQPPACTGRHQPTALAVEQARLQAGFGPGDAARDRALVDPQRVGRASQSGVARNG